MTVDPRFGPTLRRLRQARALSLRDLARDVTHGKTYLHQLETGERRPTAATAQRLDDALHAGGALAALVDDQAVTLPVDGDGGELDALELARRVTASDVSTETLDRLDAAVDDLAVAYATTPPALLAPRVQRHLAYVGRLLDARKTLAQHRRVIVAGGWLSLLAATVHIDLTHPRTAAAHLTTAGQFAEHAEHPEIQAWCLETAAWQVLTAGDYRRAVELSQRAQGIAPRGGSAFIQATAQEGRAWARMGRQTETRDALNRVSRLVSLLPIPDRPEHHYRYDPAKALSYTATTLAWAGDPAAEEYARAAVAELLDAAAARPRRIASARLDLALALLAAGRPDEAAATAVDAIASGRVVPSNWWRATEVMTAVERVGIGEAVELRDAYESFRPVE